MTDVGVARSFADERVHVLPIGDIDSFAKEITSLLKQEKKREKADHSASKEVYRKAYVDSLKAKREKLCYVLPRYDKNDDTHFSYLPEFIGSFSAHNDVHIVIERGELPEREVFPNASVSLVRGSGLFRMLQIKWRLMQARASGYRDFYVHYSFFSAYVASVLVRVFGGRVFYWNCGEPWKYRRSFLREGFERLTYKLITYLVTGTETMKKAYGEHYGLSLEKIKVLPNWIDLGVTEKYKEDEVRRKLLIPPHAKIILFVHRISKRKGAHHLPEILKGLTDKNVVLLIVGTGPEQGRVESLMGQYGLGERVRFLGSVPHKDIARYFAAADIFLMPSEEEGFPHVLLESMAFGVPFVASRVGGVSDIVPESAKQFLVPPGDIMGYTDALRALLGESEKKHNERVKDLTSWVLRYDISTVESLFETLFW
jgi:glycosyltransferase involved in cell wall biosynthesis